MDPVTGWLIIAGLNAALASQKASQQAKQRKAEADISAAEIEAAPWTGRAPSTRVSTATPNIWAELAGAGINTLGQGMALQNAGLFTGGEALPGTPLPGGYEGGSSYMPSMKEAMGQNSSPMWPWENKQSSWLNAFKTGR